MNKPLLSAASAAARFGLLAMLGVGLAVAQTTTTTTSTSSTDPKKEEAQKLEKFEVTGSRIKRLDYETPAPVAAFSIAEIEAKGYVNIGDFIQSLPFASGTENSIYQASSFQRGASTTNLRGLGAQRSLTLVNGRRAVPYALVSPNSGTRSVFDFNSLPSAAIESVEFLKDGASAIYGSDAITGVLNIKLKKNFTGLSVSAYYGNTLKNSGGDTGTKELSLVAGSGEGKTKVITAIDIKTANSNFIRDYGTTTTDFTYLGTNKGLNQNSTSNWPANLTLTRAQATALGLAIPGPTATSWTYVINGGAPNNNPTLASFAPAPAAAAGSNTVLVGNENRYNFAQTFQVYPAYDYLSNYTSFEHEFSDTLSAFGELTYSKNSTYYAFTPGVITYSTEGLTLPVNNPYNPFGIALTTLSARAAFLPVRKFDTESTSANFLAGLRGVVADRWDWESAVSYGFSNVSTVSRNAMRASTYQAALNGTLPNFVGKFLNPFGGSDPGLTAALTTVSADSNKADSLTFDANVSGRIWTLPAGDVGIAAGFEARNDKLQTNPDTSAYLGSGGGSPLSGKRTVTSEYVEITAPLYRSREMGSAEVQLAGRHENYSDFGSTTKPKVGVKIRLPDTRWLNVIIRGSYSESFQAPPLGLLYASQTVSFTQGVTQDPLRPQDPPTQLRNVSGGNPNLLPETAKVQYVGAVFESPMVRNLSFSVDYFDIRLNQFIVSPSTAYLLTPNGMAQFPNAIVRDNTLGNPGPILRIESVPSNNPEAYQLYRGFDFGAKYSLRNTRYGDFTFTADATQILKTGTDSGLGGGFFNNAGYYFNPRWKAQASTTWSYKDYGASVNVDRIGHWYNDGYTAAGWGENPFTVVGVQLRVGAVMGSTLTFGCSNVFNNRPPPNGRQSIGFDPNAYGPGVLGRFLSVRIRRDF